MIRLNIDSQVATVTLDRPPVNALNDVWTESMNKVLDQVETHGQISVLYLRSELKVFSAGADLAIMRDLLVTPDGRDSMIDMVCGFQRVFSRLEKIAAVTVAEIGGAALGGGFELALACDLRVAAATARLGLPETRLGLIPAAGGTQRLTRICGEAVARRLILGNETVDGNEAARLGLVQWTVPAAQLTSWTRDLIRRIASVPAAALAAGKRCIAATLDDAIDGYELELAETRRLHDIPETQELINKFLVKKK